MLLGKHTDKKRKTEKERPGRGFWPIMLLAVLSMLTSCNFFDADDICPDNAYSGDSLYVKLTIEIPTDQNYTRADETPNGGEEGDGWEYGRDYENKLHDFTVFVISSESGINSIAETPIFASKYFSEDDVRKADSISKNLQLKDYTVTPAKYILTYDFKIPVVQGLIRELPKVETFRFIVVANNGDLTRQFTRLGELRDAQPTKTWTDDETDGPVRFVMTNENDKYYVNGYGSEEDPVRMHVTIERMAARIDYDPTNATLIQETGKSDKTIVYTFNDEKTPTTALAQFYLDRMAVFNACQKPSYYIKRVANDINSTSPTYLGDETPTPRGIATNYVIDPYSTQKTEANRSDDSGLLTTLFADTRISQATALLASTDGNPPALTETSKPVTIAYVNENTYTKEMAQKEYSTGIVVKGRYEPLHDFYTAYDKESGTLTAGTYTPGQDFWMVEPSQDTEVTTTETTTTTTDRSYTAISEADRHYFSTEAAAIAYATDTRHKHYGRVVKNTGGVCYYFFYLRHSNNVAVIHDTMEFGIVRNNIYRFKIEAATGPGTPDADPRHPEELKASVYVKKWILVNHPLIYV